MDLSPPLPPPEECIEVAIPEIQRIQKYWTGHSNTATKPSTIYTELNRNKFILIQVQVCLVVWFKLILIFFFLDFLFCFDFK